jgi:glucosyl-dolichyl phosphate glucuronosyltransferase
MHAHSVILCAYTESRWGDLLGAVESVRRQTLLPQEIIVVVDHNDRLLARVQSQLPDVVAVANSEARGLSGARNSGVAAARGELIVFLDDDAVARPDWLARLAAPYAEPHVAAVGGAIEPQWLSRRPAWFPSEFNWVVGCTYRGMPERGADVRNLIGCNMSFHRSVFAAIGGFRIGRVGTLSIGQENDETELCIRLTAARPQARIFYQPAAAVQHLVRPERGTFAYFTRRCYSEGVSKATLSRMVGRGQGLASERAYTLRTLPQGVLRGIGDTFLRRDPAGLLRAGAIVAGLAITTAGYLSGMAFQRVTGRFRPAAQADMSTVELPG